MKFQAHLTFTALDDTSRMIIQGHDRIIIKSRNAIILEFNSFGYDDQYIICDNIFNILNTYFPNIPLERGQISLTKLNIINETPIV